VTVPATARRIRVTGCTAVEICLVADGSAAAWHDLDRSGTHVHDVAGGLAVLAAAGGVALTVDGEPLLLRPDTEEKIRFAAAATADIARELVAAVGAR
jgi:3'(2'), 5'-bisphosphate nucleotidase